MSFNVISLRPAGPCCASFGVSGGSVAGRVALNATQGYFINVTQDELGGMVRGANALYPGCDFGLQDLFIGKIFVHGTGQNGGVPIMKLDTVSLGRGQNLFSGSQQ